MEADVTWEQKESYWVCSLLALMKWGFPVISVRRARQEAGEDLLERVSGKSIWLKALVTLMAKKREFTCEVCARKRAEKKAPCFVALPAAVHTACQALPAKCLSEALHDRCV